MFEKRLLFIFVITLFSAIVVFANDDIINDPKINETESILSDSLKIDENATQNSYEISYQYVKASFDESVRRDPDNIDSYKERAIALCVMNDNYADIIWAFKEWEKKDPKNSLIKDALKDIQKRNNQNLTDSNERKDICGKSYYKLSNDEKTVDLLQTTAITLTENSAKEAFHYNEIYGDMKDALNLLVKLHADDISRYQQRAEKLYKYNVDLRDILWAYKEWDKKDSNNLQVKDKIIEILEKLYEKCAE